MAVHLQQRLQFAEPDQLTTTHEYPSERAMIEQLGISPDFDLDSAGEMSLDDPSAIFGLDDADGEMNDGGRATNRLLGGSSGIGSGEFSERRDGGIGGEDNAEINQTKTRSQTSVLICFLHVITLTVESNLVVLQV